MSDIDPYRTDCLHIRGTVSSAQGQLAFRDFGTVITLKVLKVLAQFPLQETRIEELNQ